MDTVNVWLTIFRRVLIAPMTKPRALEDLRDGLHFVRTLLKLGRYQAAFDAYGGALSRALLFNLEAYAETLSLLRPFFPHDWSVLPTTVNEQQSSYLANDAAIALSGVGTYRDSLATLGAALARDLRRAVWPSVSVRIQKNCAVVVRKQNRLAQEDRFTLAALNLATLKGNRQETFVTRLNRFDTLALSGRWEDAQALWDLLDPMGRTWSRATYRPGDAEESYTRFEFWRGDLSEQDLNRAEQTAEAGYNRTVIRHLHVIRGEWLLDHHEWPLATKSLHEAVAMARAIGNTDAHAETLLALAQLRLGQLNDPRSEADRLANTTRPASRALAELWFAIGDIEQAKRHALAAYKWAWADGEPYVRRYELTKAHSLLDQLGVEIPNLPHYDPTKDQKLPWEDDVAAAIENLAAEKAAQSAKAD